MNQTCSECGRTKFRIAVVKTQQCTSCYGKAYRKKHADEYAEGGKYHSSNYYESAYTYTAACPSSPRIPCSYGGAHHRVRKYFGKASEYECVWCGRDAESWSYKGGSQYEMSGYRSKRQKNGGISQHYSVWSTYIFDYEPLCEECHLTLDRHIEGTIEWGVRVLQHKLKAVLDNGN